MAHSLANFFMRDRTELPSARHLLLLSFLLLGVAGHWVLEAFGDRATDFWTGALIHGAATVPYVLLCRAAVHGRYGPSFWQAFSIAVVIRLLAIPLQPALSDDVYRYMHEGTMVSQGENPYLTAPADAREDLRHPEYWSRINHPEVAAAYPPAVQFTLAAGVAVAPSPLGMKIVFGLCDLMVFVVLWVWLPVIGARAKLAIVHGFCPLLALEFAGEGHSDSLAVLFIVLCLYAFARHRQHLAAGMLAIATAGKLLPVVLLPFVARRARLAIVTFSTVLALLYLPFVAGVPLEDWPKLFQGTLRYADAWRANDSVFHLVHSAVEWGLAWLAEAGVETDLRFYPHRLAKLPIVLFGGAILVLAWVKDWPIQKVAAGVFMVFVSFTPTMHPWYLAFLVPFLCLYPSTLWLIFTGTIYLAYHVRPEWVDVHRQVDQVAENLGIKIAEYVPLYLGFASVLFDTRSAAATDRQTRSS